MLLQFHQNSEWPDFIPSFIIVIILLQPFTQSLCNHLKWPQSLQLEPKWKAPGRFPEDAINCSRSGCTCRRKNWEGWGVTHATLERETYFQGLCADECLCTGSLDGDWGAGQGEGEEREREWGRLLSSKDLSETLQVNEGRSRDPEALRPDSHTQTDGQARGLTDPQKTESLRRTYSLSWRWRGVR